MVALTCRGAAAQLMVSRDEVVLIEGPAGTGKSLIACHKFHAIGSGNAKLRILLARKTRRSLTDSIMVTYENAVLSQYSGGPHMLGKGRSNRDRYVYPNGTEVVLGGFDDPAKILSSEYDIIVVEQAEQCLLGDIEIALSRLRNNSGYEPKQLIMIANPGAPTHWLMSWAKSGKLRWLRSTIKDNPLYWDSDKSEPTQEGARYLAKVNRLSGVNYKRYVLGEWCGEEGQILRYDPRRHILHGRMVRESSGWWLEAEDRPRVRLDWFIVGVDWGSTVPGALVVIGFDRDRRGYVVEHYYKSKQTTDWWAGVAERVWQKYEPVAYVCDSAEPDRIAVFNDRLSYHYGRDVGAAAVAANKAVLTGIAELQEGIDNDELFFLHGSLAHAPDPEIQEGQPTDIIGEIDQWIWLVDKQSGLSVDRPDPRRRDDAIDAMRYAWMWARTRDYANRTPPIPRSVRHLLEEQAGVI